MRDPHPLAIIPLSNDNSIEDSGDLPIRALVPHSGSAMTTTAAGRGEAVRSEDDTALMMSLISLMPHERADSQFSVTSPVRRSGASDTAVRHESWFGSRRPNSSAFGGSAERGDEHSGGSSCSTSDGGAGGGGGAGSRREGRGGRRGRSSGGGGLDFLGTTDSVRELFHLPYTSEAVTVGLHRVGETLVLDGNLDEVLAPAAAAAAAAKAPTPAPPPPPSSGASSTANPTGGGRDSNGNTMIGGGGKEGRWVMVGKGGKPQQRVNGEGEGGQEWRNSGEGHSGCFNTRKSMTPSGVPRDEQWMEGAGDGAQGGRGERTLPHGRSSSRGGEDGSSGGRPCKGRVGPGTGRRRQEFAPSSYFAAGELEPVTGQDQWSVTNLTSWPALGAPDAAAAAASSSGDDAALLAPSNPDGGGILSIVPSRPRAQSFGVQPPEPAGFRRSFEWELAGMHLVLGSSLPVCSTSEHPQVSVRLHDGDEDLSLCTCLDYYLDNIMESVPELALCMREKGYIQGCRVVSTEDIPYLGSLLKKAAVAHGTAAAAAAAAAEAGPQEGGVGGVAAGAPVPMFDPDVVELNATILLRFLQENCSREGGTYLLHRSEGAAHVQLYDVSALSKQRHRRWKWLLAMLCYRFALRISHHTRQSWCRGGQAGKEGGGRGSFASSADGSGPVDVSSSPGPEVVRQLQRRQRQLLENSLELLEELAELGGGGHETICASVQEHIADTYLGYSNGSHVALPGPGDGSSSNGGDGNAEISRGRPRRGRWKEASTPQTGGSVEPAVGDVRPRRAAWTVDSEGGVWTSPPPLRPPPPVSGKAKGAADRKGKRRSDVQGSSGAGRKTATPRDGFDGESKGGGSHPGSVRLGGGGGGDGVPFPAGAGACTTMDENAERQREENLDKAQDHLTSGIAILRGVMARQESAAAGRDGRAADVVIVGESKLPVAIMRQPHNPWRAVDDEEGSVEEEEEEEGEQQSRDDGRVGKHGHMTGGGGGDGSCVAARRRRRRRRGSQDESEDPATALSVVSEQLWGLQQKLVGTYMAVARARLGRAFPDPALATSSGNFKRKPGMRTGSGGNGNGKGSRSPKEVEGAAAGDDQTGAESGSGHVEEDGPDEETRAELVRGALDSLCAAWEHLVEAKSTLDRRSAAVLTGEEEGSEADVDEGVRNGGMQAAVVGDDRRIADAARAPAEGGVAVSRERAEKLGALWKGSLSEALARSGHESGNGSGGIDAGRAKARAARNPAGVSGTAADDDAPATSGAARFRDADNDKMGRLAWTRAARGQLESRRAELFELCGDVAHACVSLRARRIGAGASMAASAGNTEAQRSLPARLQELLSSTSPPLKLEDLDVCQGLHANVLEAFKGSVKHGGITTSTKTGASTSGKKGRGSNRGLSQAEPGANGSRLTLSGTDDSDMAATLAASMGGSTAPSVDPRLPIETCVHELAKAGRVPGDPTAWSLCLAAEACYERALLDLDRIGGVLIPDFGATGAAVAAAGAVAFSAHRPGSNRLDAKRAIFTGVPKAQARIRKKLGDASNELGKLMAQCAGLLVQAPAPAPLSPHPLSADREGAQPASSIAPGGASASAAAQPPQHPGPACAMCVACAERWFRRSLAQFREIDDPRNTALLLCNLASVERLKPRALTRLREACPTMVLPVESGGGGQSSSKSGEGKEGSSSYLRGAAAAVELCGEAHAMLGRREEDERTWDHASGELAMSHLCLGVERRQELLATLLRADTANETLGSKGKSSAKMSGSSAPTVAQVRSVVAPLEQALQIYTDMKNAPQAAACHYQIGQYYAKILPAYIGSHSSVAGESAASSSSRGGSAGRYGSGRNTGGGAGVQGFNDEGSSALRVAKAWEVGQRAARHFLAAQAYFAPFEHGPTSVLLALDLCNLYVSLAELGGPATGGGGSGGSAKTERNYPPSPPSASSSVARRDDFDIIIPIPPAPSGEGSRGAGATAASGHPGSATTGGGRGGHRLRPTVAVRSQCLEGALRSLLDTRSVFADAGVDVAVEAVVAAAAAAESAAGRREQHLRRLLDSVAERLPKVLQALVRSSVEMGSSSSSSSPTARFKSMYRTSLLAMRGGGGGARAMLARLATEYGALEGGEVCHD